MTNQIINERIIKDMLRFSPCPIMEHVVPIDNLYSLGLNKKESDFLINNPNAHVYAALFDFQIKYQGAWKTTYILNQRLGHLNPNKLALMSIRELHPYIKGRERNEDPLHRFNEVLTKRVI